MFGTLGGTRGFVGVLGVGACNGLVGVSGELRSGVWVVCSGRSLVSVSLSA